jgi:sulfur-carrier protein
MVERGTISTERTTRGVLVMAVEVRIPTILRPFTGGEKAVPASGNTLGEVVASLDANYPGIGERLLDDGELRRFVNVYVNDEDVRFLDGLATPLKDSDSVTILPAVAGGALALPGSVTGR